MAKKTYYEMLKDPRWQKKRLEILEREEFTCERCFATDKTLHVHHTYYEKGLDLWDYPPYSLHVLCEQCHERAQRYMQRIHAEIGRLRLEQMETLLGILRVLATDDDPLARLPVENKEVARGMGLIMGGIVNQVDLDDLLAFNNATKPTTTAWRDLHLAVEAARQPTTEAVS